MKKTFLLSLFFLISINHISFSQGWLDKIKEKVKEKQERIIDQAEEKIENRAENLVNEELRSLRNSYDTSTFGYAIAFIDNADLYEEKQRGQKAKRFLARLSEESGVTREDNTDPLKTAKDYYDLGEIAYASRSYRRAERSFLKSEEEFESLGRTSHPLYSKLVNNLGLLYYTTKQLDKAEEYIEKALALSQNNSEQQENKIAALNNQAMVWKDQGLYTESEKQFEEIKSLQNAENQENSISSAIVLNNQAILYQELGRYKEADKRLSEALEIAALSLNGSSNTYQRFLINQALLYQQMKRYEEAEALFLKSIELKEKRIGTRNHPDLAHMLTGLAALYLEMNKTEKTEELLLEAQRIYEKKLGRDNLSYAKASNYLGQFYRNQNKLKDAEEQLNTALEIREEQLGKTHIKTIETQEQLALLYWKQNKIEETKELFEIVVSHNYDFIKNYFPAMSETEKERYWTKIRPTFLRFYAFVTDTKYKGKYPELQTQMHNAHLATKAILLNTTNRIKESVLNSKDKELIGKYQKWIDNREQLIELYSYTPEELAEQGVDREALEKQTNQIEKSLSESLPQLFDENDSKTYQDIRNALPSKSAFVDIISFPIYPNKEQTQMQYVALIGSSSLDVPSLVALDTNKELDDGEFHYYRNTVQMKIENEDSFKAYWKPIYEELESIKNKENIERIFVSLDGIYHQININTLSLSDGSFVIDHQNLVFVNNLKDLTKKQENKDNSNAEEIVLVGFPNYGNKGKIVPLPGTKTEVNAVEAILKKNNYKTRVILGNSADEESVKSVRSPCGLHIATHGYFLKDNSISTNSDARAFGLQASLVRQNPLLRSGIMLTGAESALESQKSKETTESNNGILTAYEARGLDLEDTEFVILSACETGLGDVKGGEGVYGLQRAFQLAGAKSTIMSLWKVSDEATARLMTYFYQYWTETENVSNAFRKAQRQLKKEYPNPYFWGAFILTQTEIE